MEEHGLTATTLTLQRQRTRSWSVEIFISFATNIYDKLGTRQDGRVARNVSDAKCGLIVTWKEFYINNGELRVITRLFVYININKG